MPPEEKLLNALNGYISAVASTNRQFEMRCFAISTSGINLDLNWEEESSYSFGPIIEEAIKECQEKHGVFILSKIIQEASNDLANSYVAATLSKTQTLFKLIIEQNKDYLSTTPEGKSKFIEQAKGYLAEINSNAMYNATSQINILMQYLPASIADDVESSIVDSLKFMLGDAEMFDFEAIMEEYVPYSTVGAAASAAAEAGTGAASAAAAVASSNTNTNSTREELSSAELSEILESLTAIGICNGSYIGAFMCESDFATLSPLVSRAILDFNNHRAITSENYRQIHSVLSSIKASFDLDIALNTPLLLDTTADAIHHTGEASAAAACE